MPSAHRYSLLALLVAALDLLVQSTELHGVALISYCLMSNHIYLIAIPRKAEVLARALRAMRLDPITRIHSE